MAKKKVPSKLTDKMALFCKEYIIDLNATQAAIRAGYSEKTAQAIGTENLSKPIIQAEIERLNKKRFEKLEDDGQNVINELAKIAFSDITDYVDIDQEGCVKCKSIDSMKNTGVISSIKEKRTIKQNGNTGAEMILDNTFEFKMWDKTKALNDLAKHYGLFEKDNNQNTGPIIISLSKEDERI